MPIVRYKIQQFLEMNDTIQHAMDIDYFLYSFYSRWPQNGHAETLSLAFLKSQI